MQTGNIHERIENLVGSYDHWTADWIRTFLKGINENPAVRESENGIAEDLVAIAYAFHANQDSDYDGPSNLRLDRLDKYPEGVKHAVLRQIYLEDRYGPSVAEARRYAQLHGIDITSRAAASAA